MEDIIMEVGFMNRAIRVVSILVTLTLLALSLQASFGAAQGAELILVMNNQTPYPVEPGGVVTIEMTLQNDGSSASDSITIEFIQKEPFTLLPGQDSTKVFSRIGPNSGIKFSLKLKVDESAVSETYELEFKKYMTANPDLPTTNKFPVIVQGVPNIIIKSVQTDPAVIEPGDEVEISVNLMNEGTGKASQTAFSLVADPDSETEESLIVPVLGGGVFYLGNFEPGEEATAKFMMGIENSAESKNYISTLSVSYMDENSESQSTSYTIGIPVKGNPVIELLSAKVDNGAFKVDIENIGTGIAKALKIAFVQDGEVKDSSVANELKPTKHKTIRFQGFTFGNAAINVSYLDESNEYFVNEFPVTVKQAAASEEQTGGGVSSSVAIVLVLVIVLESYYVWRIRKRLKK
jgi:hypothetical protein